MPSPTAGCRGALPTTQYRPSHPCKRLRGAGATAEPGQPDRRVQEAPGASAACSKHVVICEGHAGVVTRTGRVRHGRVGMEQAAHRLPRRMEITQQRYPSGREDRGKPFSQPCGTTRGARHAPTAAHAQRAPCAEGQLRCQSSHSDGPNPWSLPHLVTRKIRRRGDGLETGLVGGMRVVGVIALRRCRRPAQ